MVVKLDLRLPGKRKIKLDSENNIKHSFVFAAAAAFLLTLFAVLLLGGWRSYSLHKDKAELISEKTTATRNLELMEKEFARLNGEAADINEKLDFMLGDVPTIEVITVLDAIIPKNVSIQSLNIKTGVALFKGTALSEEDVMLFVDKLSAAPFTISVGVPVIKRTKLRELSICSYSIECKLRSMQEILQTGVFPEPEKSNVSGDDTL